MQSEDKENSLLPVRRALQVLKLCSEHREGLSFSELKTHLHPIAPGILSRLLKSLILESALEKNSEGLYTTGKFLQDLYASFNPRLDLRFSVSKLVTGLSADVGFSAGYFELRDGGLFLYAKSEVTDGFHYIEPERAMGNIPNHVFSQTVLAFGGKDLCRKLALKQSTLREKIIARRICEIRKGKLAFFDLDNKKIFRIAFPVFCKRKICGVVGISTYDEIKNKESLNKTISLLKNTAKKIGELYESNNGNV